MQKPNDFEVVQAYAGFTPLTPGGHILVIKKVEEVKTQKGSRPMINIYIDTDKADKQPSYYMEQWNNNKNSNRQWHNNAIVRQLVYDADNNTNRGFKTFIEMVEKSNNGFKVQWGDNFAKCFIGKLVGGIFAREEYEKDGVYKFSTKHQFFTTVEDIKNGVEVPKDKLLNPSNEYSVPGGGDITPVDDSDMPF